MAKGSIAKQNVLKKIQAAFGEDFIGEYDKKVYVWASENGERIQIALSMTCPKVQIEVDNSLSAGDFNFEDQGGFAVPVMSQPETGPVEITDEERKNIEDIMARLGL